MAPTMSHYSQIEREPPSILRKPVLIGSNWFHVFSQIVYSDNSLTWSFRVTE